MSHLMRARKADLILLAQELGEEATEANKMIELNKIILGSSHYEEEMVKSILETIIASRKELEERAEQEKKLEYELKLREAEKEHELKLREAEKEEKRLAWEHELKLKELECKQNENGSSANVQTQNDNLTTHENQLMKYLNLVKDQLPRAPERTENWVFFFHQVETIFEIYGIPEEFQGKIILHKLSHFIRQLTNNLGIEQLTEYKAIKESILAENSLTPLQHKKNFEESYKKHFENYVQWGARLKTNLEYYLESRNVNDFQEIKNLIISDKIKDSLPNYIRSHILLKEGTNWLKPLELVREIDHFLEAQPIRSQRNEGARRDFDRGSGSVIGRLQKETARGGESNGTQGKSSFRVEREKPKIQCFECGENHFRYQCPHVKEKQDKENRKVLQVRVRRGPNVINSQGKLEEEVQLSTVKINIAGKEIDAIKDSGSEIMVLREDLVPDKYKTGESVLLIPAVGEGQRADLVCLPVKLGGESRGISPEINITAAVTPKLNCAALITPTVYEKLVKQTHEYDTNELLKETGRGAKLEGRRDEEKVNLEGVYNQERTSASLEGEKKADQVSVAEEGSVKLGADKKQPDENKKKGAREYELISERCRKHRLEMSDGKGNAFEGMFSINSRDERERDLGEKTSRFMNVYIKNFGDDLDDNKLRELFEKYGKITSAKVMVDEMGNSKGFGFVSFRKFENAKEAVEGLNGWEINGKTLYVGPAQKKSERVAELKRRFEIGKMKRMNRYQGVNLYVKHLDDVFNDERLRKEFSPFGIITSAKVMVDSNGRSKGFGFVCFRFPEGAAKAINEMNGKMIGSKSLYVDLAQCKKERKAHLASQYMENEDDRKAYETGSNSRKN